MFNLFKKTKPGAKLMDKMQGTKNKNAALQNEVDPY
jgi:hypothetical protein